MARKNNEMKTFDVYVNGEFYGKRSGFTAKTVRLAVKAMLRRADEIEIKEATQ